MRKKVHSIVFEILDFKSEDLPGKIFNVSIVTLILLSVLSVILETDETIYSRHESFFVFLIKKYCCLDFCFLRAV